MKRFIVALLLLGLMASGVMAADPGREVTTYILSGNVWDTPAETAYGLGARAFTVPAASCGAEDMYDGHCCKEVWNIDICNTAVVTQWLNYTFGASGWSWQVRKPGEYAADCMSFVIQSNADVQVSFADFNDLVADGSSLAQGSIPVQYSYTLGSTALNPPAASEDAWYTPDELNALVFTLPYDQIKSELNCKLWNRIKIEPDTHSGTYSDTGTVTFTLTDVKDFIDPVTGDFN